METIFFDKKTLESVFINDPLQKIDFTFGDLFETAKNLNINDITNSQDQNFLIISSNPFFIISFILKCWINKNIPAVLSPRLYKDDYKQLFREVKFRTIVTDDKELSELLGINHILFELHYCNNLIENINFEYKIKNTSLILFSSGTSGEQKIIPLSFENIILNINAFSKIFINNLEISFLCTSPIWFAHGLYNSFLHGFFLQKKVIYSGVLNTFNATKILEYCSKIPNIIYHLTPSMIPILLLIGNKIKNKNLPKFLFAICGTSFLDTNAKLSFEKIFNTELIQQYGMTELLFISFNNKPILKPKSVGIPLDIVNLKIKNNLSYEEKNQGKIFIKSPSFCGRYLNKSEKITVDEEGYFFTGDIGYLDEDGYLFITGREKEIIKKGGYSISSSFLNSTIKKFGNIIEVHTIGKVDENLGEEIYCFIKQKKKIDLDKLREFIRSKTPINIMPSNIIILDEIPKNEMGKVSKKKLDYIIDKLKC